MGQGRKPTPEGLLLHEAASPTQPNPPPPPPSCRPQLHNNTDDAEPMRLHIGMNTGDVVLGTIGTESRMETTTVGDAVNVASRMASLSHMYQTPFLCSHSTRTHLKKKSGVRFRALGPARVKGRPHPVNVCEVLDVQSEEQQTLKSASDDIFQVFFWGGGVKCGEGGQAA